MKYHSEPSGVRLMRLINARSLEIAKQENRNRGMICLYGTGSYWTAFEHSAYSLGLIFPDSESFVVNNPGYPYPIVGLSIPEKKLRQYMKSHDPNRQSIDYIEFTAPLFTEKEYDDWHSKVVRSYRAAVSDAPSSPVFRS